VVSRNVTGVTAEESRDGVPLTHLDEPLFDGAEATKRNLVDYVEQMADRMVSHLRDRPLSVIRVRAGQAPFMQKNLPQYAPEWIASVSIWAERTKRDVTYALANDRRTLVWFANQRAVEYHPGLMTTDDPLHQTHLILDLDPPSGVDAEHGFRLAVRATHLVKQVLDEAGPRRGRKDQRCQGNARVRPSRLGGAPGCRRRDTRYRRPRREDRPRASYHGLRRRAAARQGLRGLDPRRRSDGDRGLQPTGSSRRSGVVPGRLGRPRRHQSARTSRCTRRPGCSTTATPGRR
jgi:hypothetical protein